MAGGLTDLNPLSEGGPTDPHMSLLIEFGTSTISDAMDRLGVVGAVHGIRPLTATRPIAGHVVTLKLDQSDGSRSTRHLGSEAISSSLPGDVIVVDNDGRETVGCWGGLLSTSALVAGCSGVILHGATRDVARIRARGLPVYARAAVPISARGRVREIGTQIPVSIGSVRVYPGDMAVADEDGVVFVQSALVAEVIRVAREIADAERDWDRALLAGRPPADVLGERYESLTRGGLT